MDKINEYQRVYAKIDLDALNYNFKNIASITNDETKIIAVLKTDAYGHCAVPLAKDLEGQDKLWGFALATAEEAMILRNSGITKPLLILGYTFPNAYEEMIKNDITFTVFRKETLGKLAQVCRKISTPSQKFKAKIHIKVDTGMGRIGILPDNDGIDFIKEAISYEELDVEGIFTHLAKSDDQDRCFTMNQLSIYNSFVERIKNELDFEFKLKHVLNSAGIIEYPEADFDAVRAGIILYGLWPSEDVSKDRIDLKPVFSLYSSIVYIKNVLPNTPISYGGTYVSDKVTKVATVSIGYGEGYPRSLSNKAEVLVKGIRCPIIGRICMDQLMIDVSQINDVTEGDIVTLIGADGDDCITMEELGALSGRFNYEMACDFGKRIPRVFIKDHQVKYTKDYYLDF